MNSAQRSSQWITALVGIDPRALAIFRIGLGLLVLWDQLHALRSVEAFYTDAGVLPRVDLLAQLKSARWSLHLLSGSTEVQVLLILTACLAAVALVLGYQTRRALFITWLLTASLQARNPGVLYGADTVLRVLQFWCLFLPLGSRWSVDAMSSAAKATPEPVRSMASTGLLVQVALIYWFTAALKYGPEWTYEASAVYYALSVDQFTHGLGHWLLQHPKLCEWLTRYVWWAEIAAPIIAFIPWRTGLWRMIVTPAMMVLHLGLACCMRIGYFPSIMILCWVVFLPSGVWNMLEPTFQRLMGWFRAPRLLLAHAGRPVAQWQTHAISQAICILLLIGVVWQNITTLNPKAKAPLLLRRSMNLVRLDQHWALFAPSPLSDDGWLILDALCYDGQHRDILRAAQPLNWDKPSSLSSTYPDWKWQKLQGNLPYPEYQGYAQRLGDYLCQQYSAPQPAGQRVRSWKLWFMRETTMPNYTTLPLRRYELAQNAQFVVQDDE
jgi:hypothetical protein